MHKGGAGVFPGKEKVILMDTEHNHPQCTEDRDTGSRVCMNYEEFELVLKADLYAALPEGTKIGTEYVPRNRGCSRRGMTIHRKGEQVSPVIPLDECYRQYCEGTDMAELTRDILQICSQCGSITTDIADLYENWEYIRTRIVRRIVSRQGNETMLQSVPFRTFLDLAVIYYCVFESREGFEAGVLVKDSHLQLWGVGQEELDRMADINMPKICPSAFYTMQEMMGDLLGVSLPEEEGTYGLYVLTNQSKCYGAVYMSDPKVLQGIAERLREDFYVLPSSLHECMIVPESLNHDELAMKQMVTEINCTQVAPEEVLANSVYHYDRKTGQLRLAAG